MADEARGPGRPKVIETDEFKEAVASAVEQRVSEIEARLVEKIASQAVTAVVPPSNNMETLLLQVLEKLSVNMGAIANQGERRKPLTPAQIAEREAGEKRMGELILDVRQLPAGHRPLYRVISKTCLNERLIEPLRRDKVSKVDIPQEIEWTGVPNDAMVPLNEAAKHIHAAWRQSTGGRTELVPTADNRPLYTTANGLVVRGDPPVRRMVAADVQFADDLALPNDPTAPEVAVLGTIHPRAKQNAAGLHWQHPQADTETLRRGSV